MSKQKRYQKRNRNALDMDLSNNDGRCDVAGSAIGRLTPSKLAHWTFMDRFRNCDILPKSPIDDQSVANLSAFLKARSCGVRFIPPDASKDFTCSISSPGLIGTSASETWEVFSLSFRAGHSAYIGVLGFHFKSIAKPHITHNEHLEGYISFFTNFASQNH